MNKVCKRIVEIWGTNDPNKAHTEWLKSYWLIKKQLEEIEADKFTGTSLLKEYSDIVIIILEYFMGLGLDPEKVLLQRLETRYEGQTDEIKAKYEKMWKIENSF
jgi:hypothetical protein